MPFNLIWTWRPTEVREKQNSCRHSIYSNVYLCAAILVWTFFKSIKARPGKRQAQQISLMSIDMAISPCFLPMAGILSGFSCFRTARRFTYSLAYFDVYTKTIISLSMMTTTTDYLNQHTDTPDNSKERIGWRLSFWAPLIDTAHPLARILVFFSQSNENECLSFSSSFSFSFSPSCWSWHLFSHWSTVLSIDQTNQYEQHPGDDERRRYRRRRRKAVCSPHRTANESEKERVGVINEYLQRRGEREKLASRLSLFCTGCQRRSQR